MADTSNTLTRTQAEFLRRFVMALPDGEDVDDTSEASLAGTISLVALQKARLAWDGERKRVAAELKSLEASMVAAFKEAEDAKEMAQIATKVHRVLKVIDHRLLETLDEALNAATIFSRGACLIKAAGLIDAYLSELETHPLIQLVESNPFQRVNIVKGLRLTLRGLRSELT